MRSRFTINLRPVAACAVAAAMLPILVNLTALSTFAWADQSSASSNLAEAASAEKAGNYLQAASYYRKILEDAQAQQVESAEFQDLRVHLAKDYFMLRRYQDSLEALQPMLVQQVRDRSRVHGDAALVTGMDDLELNRLSEAMKWLRLAVKLEPESGTARFALGDALARSGQLQEAASEYRQQLARTPSVADGWYKLGVVYSKFSAMAVQDFEERHPANPVIKQFLAETSLERGDSAAAFHALVGLLRTNPGQPGLHADLGTALLGLGYTHQASEQFRAELSQDPESPAALFGLAEVDALGGDWETAFRAFIHVARFHPWQFRQKLELAPPARLTEAWRQGRLNPPARWADSSLGKVWTNWLAGQGTQVHPTADSGGGHCASLSGAAAKTPGIWLTRECYEDLRSHFESRTDSASAGLAKLAEAEFRLGDYERSRAEAEILARRQPANGWAVYWLARSDEALAYRCFQRLSSINPSSARVREILAQLDAQHFKWSRAEEEYKSAIRLAPGLPDLHLGLGTVYWQARNWVPAEAELERTLQLDPASPVAAYELGDCYLEQHQWRTAIPYLRRAKTAAAVSYRARLDLAQAEEKTGNTPAALRELLPMANEDQDGVLHYRLALLYRQLGDSADAERALARSQAIRRTSAQADQRQIQQAQEDIQRLQPASQIAHH